MVTETIQKIKAEEMAILRRAETMMVRRMCGVSLKDRKCSDELLNRLGIECRLITVDTER